MKNKTAFITGAAKGIGRATAVALSSFGSKIIITDIDEGALENTKEELEKMGAEVASYILDVSKPNDITSVHQQAQKEHQQIDYFVNNAGISGALAPLHLTPAEEWNKVINVDLTSVFYCLQEQAKSLCSPTGAYTRTPASFLPKIELNNPSPIPYNF